MTDASARPKQEEKATGPGAAFDAFRYLIFDRSELYREIVEVFTVAKAEFRLHLRPAEISSRLLESGLGCSDEDLTGALDQLVQWGNLQSYHDSAEAATLADFQRRRLLYQLTAEGEAAQRAALEFLQLLARPLTLEAESLVRIRDLLSELGQLGGTPDRDAGKIATILRTIADDTEKLTAQAQSFFRWLHEQTSLRGAELASFLQYKERLIDYLQRFLAELAQQSGPIAARVVELEPLADEYLGLVARQEAAAAFVKDESERQASIDAAHLRWRQRWRGLRRWFVGIEGDPQVKQLRSAAGAAIPRLLAIAAQLHDQRSSRSNRRADMVELAVWFLEAEDDRQAHRLWSAAFAAGSVRHLRVDPAALDQRDQQRASAGLSWLDAPPIPIAPQLRQTGRAPAPAPTRKIVDRTAQRNELRRRQTDEQARLSLARRRLIELGPRRLAEIGHVEHESLLLLIELLDRAASQRPSGQPATARSEDGSLRIVVDWNVPPATATIATPLGRLHTRDARIEILAAGDA